MIDPVDINAQDAIEMLTNHEVEPVVCTERELNQLIGQVYGMQSGLGGVLESIEELKIDSSTDSDTVAGPATDDLQVSSLQGMAEEAPIVRLVNSIISQAVREGASDIHLSPQMKNVQVRFRIDGRLHEVPAPPKQMFLPIISRIKILANMDIATSRIPPGRAFHREDGEQGDQRHPGGEVLVPYLNIALAEPLCWRTKPAVLTDCFRSIPSVIEYLMRNMWALSLVRRFGAQSLNPQSCAAAFTIISNHIVFRTWNMTSILVLMSRPCLKWAKNTSLTSKLTIT
jgi:hypothetical protein